MMTSNSRRVPLDKRKRTETSCDKCKSRKQKCRKEPGQDECRYCILHGIECQTTQPRKKRLYGSVEGLGNRLALLESLVKGLVPDADLSSIDEMRQLGTSLGIPLPDNGDGNATSGDSKSGGGGTREGDSDQTLLPDQQGQVQYIGPASSFSFHLKLRALVGREKFPGFVLFGRNAADQEPLEGVTNGVQGSGGLDHQALSTPSNTSNLDYTNSPNDGRSHSNATSEQAPSLDALISSYFETINPDFPILHEASFREVYEKWIHTPSNADPAWLCSLLCVLILSRRITCAPYTFPEAQERHWWKRIQTLIPVVIFTSSVFAVQALMLTALHLHNTNHRDASWNLTGTAVRIAFAIGLHQDKVNTMQSPLSRELRKRLWWTLYAFEQMQVSSYDRPSAIDSSGSKISCPNERIIGMSGYSPPDYTKWFNRLAVLLGSACRALKTTQANAAEDSYIGPLSPAAGVLRDLGRWKEALPSHLRLDIVDSSPPSFQRPLLLLHGMFHYIVTVLSRSALLYRATVLSKDGKDPVNTALTTMFSTCVDSGRSLARALLKLDALNKFDAVTWWDIWYTLASGSILLLDVVCCVKEGAGRDLESRALLRELSSLAAKHIRNPNMPGTISKFASIVVELYSMIDTSPTASTSTEVAASGAAIRSHDRINPDPTHLADISTSQLASSRQYPQSTTSSGAYIAGVPPDDMLSRYVQEPECGATSGWGAVGQRSQLAFVDYTIDNIQEWNWDDLGALLRTNSHGQGHVS